METSGGVFTVTNIPNWKAYTIVINNIKELSIYYMANEVFSTPFIDHNKPDTKGKKGCPVCLYTNDKKCPWLDNKHLTPGKTFTDGCEFWVKNNHIMF